MKHRTGYLFKRGDNFYVNWRVNGKLFSKALRDDQGQPITTRRGAEEARDKFMAPLAVADEATALKAIADNIDVRTVELARLDEERNPALALVRTWSAYLESTKRPDTGPDTLAVYEGQFGQFVDWMVENHPSTIALRDVTEEIAEEYATHLNQRGGSPNTFNKHIRVLDLVFRVLFKRAKLTVNPWEEIKRKELTTSSRRELTVEELKRVCRNAVGDLRPLLALGLYTGLRLRDCATLRWGEVDLARGVICRVPNKTARRHPAPVIIPIHPALRTEIERLSRSTETDYLLPEIAVDYTSGGAGKKRVINRIQDHFVGQKVAIHKPGTGPGTNTRAVVEVGFHSLRHTFVSLCRESNAPLAVVEAIVGHSNPAMTRHYTHIGELAASRAVAALPAVIGEAKSNSVPAEADNDRAKALAVAKSMTAKNWKAKKALLLALLNENNGVGQAALTQPN